MALDTLQLTNFRSYEDRLFKLSKGTTLVVGPNASGKTNLLEGIYVLATTKSFRTRDQELIRHEQSFFRIVGNHNGKELALGYGIEAGHQTKKVTHDAVKKPLSAHIGTLQAVLFEPNDLDLVVGAPEQRRRYLDSILCQTDPAYLKLLGQYKRVLRQRNSLLSAFDTSRITAEIFAWDIKLTELAAEIVTRRVALLGFIGERISHLYGEIAGRDEPIELEYLPSVKGDDYAGAFMKELAGRLTTDLAAGFTTIGPHREDFKVRFKNNDIAAVASRGETRTAVLALKMAELAYGEETSGQKPILLLDDVFSELDAARRRYLTGKIKDYQTIITATEADTIKRLGPGITVIKTEAS